MTPYAADDAPAVCKSAQISPCGLYRYRLERFWSDKPALPFVMLNPSTADADLDDPTIRRCMGFARREGAGGIIVATLHAFRATTPEELRKAYDPFGPGTAQSLETIARYATQFDMPLVCGGRDYPEDNSIAWQLTHAGRFAYCDQCDDEPE